MKLIFRIVTTTILVMLIAYFMNGVKLEEGVEASLKVAIVLSLLNVFVKPILVLFTLPATVFTFGLFLLVINAVIIMICDHFLTGFKVDSFWTAMLFSIILSFSQSLVYKISDESK